MKYSRERKNMLFWRGQLHPFIPRHTRAKACARCGYGKTNSIHVKTMPGR